MAAPTAPTAPASPANSRRFIWIAIGLLVFVIAALLVTKGGSDDTPSGAATEVFLEPVSAVGDAPFARGGDVNDAPAPQARTRPEDERAAASGRSLKSVVGTAAGLYAAARGISPCNIAKLTTALESDAGRKRAWARAAGIAPDGIPAHFEGLTGVVLRADTRVTEYAFEGGRAVPRQAILQSGTSVLVDAAGAPAVRCASGNPLAAPQPARTDAKTTGDAWTGFEPERALIVTPAPEPVEVFVVVNLTAPGYFTRPPGTDPDGIDAADGDVVSDTICDLFPDVCATDDVPAGSLSEAAQGDEAGTGETAEVSVTLQWFSTADLDLAVTDPSGATVRYDSQSVESGGSLNTDANGGCKSPTSAPSETVSWPADAAPDGEYTITVSYYDVCPGGTGAQPYTLSMTGGSVSTSGAASDEQAFAGSGATTLIAHVERASGPAALGRQASGGTLGAAGDSATSGFSVGAPAKSGPPPDLFSFAATAVGGGRVLIQWIPGTPAPGQALELGYELVVEPGGTVLRFPADTGDFDFVGEAGTNYTFTMVAINEAGESAPSTGSATVIGKPDVDLPPEDETPTTATAPASTGPPGPPPETLEDYCNRLYGPPPAPFEQPSNMMWTLCMHDPT